MKILVFCALGVLLGIFAFIWLVSRVRYRIGSRHVKVFLLGIRLRRIELASIQSISKRPSQGWTEHWWSTLRPKHRLLVLRRRRGLFRNFAITPKNRYVFKTDLERAMQRTGNASSSAQDISEPAEAVEDRNEQGSNLERPEPRVAGRSPEP